MWKKLDSIIFKDKFRLFEIESEIWDNFLEKNLAISEDENFSIDDKVDLENELKTDVLNNIIICMKLCNSFYGPCATSFYDLFLSSPRCITDSVAQETKFNWGRKQGVYDLSSRSLIKIFDYFYFENGTFPTRGDLINIPKAQTPSFVNVKLEDEKLQIKLIVLFLLIHCRKKNVHLLTKNFPKLAAQQSQDEKHEYIIKRSKIKYNNKNEDDQIDFKSKIVQHPGS